MPISKEVREVMRKELQRIGAKGGRNRWKGVSKRKRVAHARVMVAARRNGSGQ